jgi:hypothetical protein
MLALITTFQCLKENELNVKHWTEKLNVIRQRHTEDMREQNAIARSFRIESKPSSSDPDAMDVMADGAPTSNAESDEIWREKEEVLPVFSAEQLPRDDQIESLKRELSVLESEREKLKKDVNMTAIGQYKEKLYEYKYCQHTSAILIILLTKHINAESA